MPESRLKNSKRVVVKVGSNLLTSHSSLNMEVISSISRQICTLIDKGLEVLLVSSGAMAAGLKKMGMESHPEQIPQRQAIAAIGQSGLMNAYETAFAKYDKKVGQILLTSEDLHNRERYLNARNALNALLTWKVTPIINENDNVKVDEIKLGDNDNLAALIALLMDADFLVNLTDIDGLYTKDPRLFPDAQLIQQVSTFKKEIQNWASGIAGKLGTGGMLSKIKAAKKVTTAGVPMIITKGDETDILLKLFNGEQHGTYFVPREKKLASRKCWIAYTLKPKGSVIIDEGATQAVVKNGKSLLPSGIVDVQGEFGPGQPVTFKDHNQKKLGIGLVNYSSADIRTIMGLNSSKIKERLGGEASTYDEVIHRDNLVITK
jgi:glutamate 5-kinase